MRIFVAGSIYNTNSIKNIIKALEKNGHIVTYDWTNQFDSTKRKEYSLLDLDGIKRCEVFVACMEHCHTSCKGTIIEIGAALALDKKIIILGSLDTIYVSHPNVTVLDQMSTENFMNNCNDILICLRDENNESKKRNRR